MTSAPDTNCPLVEGLGFRVWGLGLGFRVQGLERDSGEPSGEGWLESLGLGFGVQNLGFGAGGSGFGFEPLRLRGQGSGFEVYGLGFRVQGSGERWGEGQTVRKLDIRHLHSHLVQDPRVQGLRAGDYTSG